MAISEKNDRQAPDRVFIAWPNDNGCGLAFTVPSKAGQTRTEFVRADLAAPSAKGDLTEWDREPFPPREIMVQMLTTAIATNWNDDRSEPQTEKRRRAIDRSEAMAMALAYIEQNEAAPSAPAEVEGLVERLMLNAPVITQDHMDAATEIMPQAARALTTQQAEKAALIEARDMMGRLWEHEKARAEKAEAERDDALNQRDIWMERAMGELGDNLAAHAKLKGEV